MAAELKAAVAARLPLALPGALQVRRNPSLRMAGSKLLNVRTAAEKAGAKYWFDVTPNFYKSQAVDYFLFACGHPDIIYVFPRVEFEALVSGASLGGDKQVPQFTIFSDTSELEPAGQSRRDIKRFLNAFGLVLAAI